MPPDRNQTPKTRTPAPITPETLGQWVPPWFPPKGGVYALIEDPGGPIRRQVARSTDDITGRMPTPDEARELDLPPGVPVFRVLRTVYDTEGRPLEVQDSLAAADRHQFRYEVEMR
jgi:GntR family transcriptional regulator